LSSSCQELKVEQVVRRQRASVDLAVAAVTLDDGVPAGADGVEEGLARRLVGHLEVEPDSVCGSGADDGGCRQQCGAHYRSYGVTTDVLAMCAHRYPRETMTRSPVTVSRCRG
jgi:hypothetical protein